MKKIKSNNDLDVSYVGGVLEILVDRVSVYNASDCFTDGIWKDSSKFDRKIRKAVKELMAAEPETPALEEPTLEEPTPEIVIPEVLEFSDEDLEDIEIVEETPVLAGPAVDAFVEKIEEKKKPSFDYRWKPKK